MTSNFCASISISFGFTRVSISARVKLLLPTVASTPSCAPALHGADAIITLARSTLPADHQSSHAILLGDEARTAERRGRWDHISRRPSRARPSVTTSAYSTSPPMGIPCAMRVTRTPRGLMSRAR